MTALDAAEIRALLNGLTGYTPGPWAISNRSGKAVRTHDQRHLVAYTDGGATCLADTNLIAAAPALADYLRVALDEIDDMDSNIEGLRAIRDFLGKNWEQAMLEVDRLRAENEQLRSALRPFAEEAEHWEQASDEDFLIERFPGYDGVVSVGDCRNARAALANRETTDDHS